MKKEILRQLKSDYEKLEIQPSADLWDRMELGKENIPRANYKTSFQWWKYAAVALFLISLGSLFYFNSNQAEGNKVMAKNSNPLRPVRTKSNVEIINSDKTHTETHIAVSPNENQGNEVEENIKVNTSSQQSLPINNSVLAAEEKTNITDFNNNPIPEEKITSADVEKPLIAERKKANYIKADELLLGSELDKTRDESHHQHKNFGVLDMEKIRVKSPNSFKILGMTIFSDTSETK